MRGVAVRSYLTDDELLFAIAHNKNSFSALIEKQFELDAGNPLLTPIPGEILMDFEIFNWIINYHRECFAAAIPQITSNCAAATVGQTRGFNECFNATRTEELRQRAVLN